MKANTSNPRNLSSSTNSFPCTREFSSSQQCIGNTHHCSAYIASPSSEKTWTMCTTFPEYVAALATIVGSVLFAISQSYLICCLIFGGVGIACLPLGLILSFIRRPKAVITHSQYIKEATELGKKAKDLKKEAESLRQEEKAGSKGRKFRKNELLQLEDVKLIEEMYPQGEKAEATWALTVLGYLAKLFLEILSATRRIRVAIDTPSMGAVNTVDPPLCPFLNEVFIKLDDIWGLLGTAAFAFFCFYLLLAVIAGAMVLGLRLVCITIHPMKDENDNKLTDQKVINKIQEKRIDVLLREKEDTSKENQQLSWKLDEIKQGKMSTPDTTGEQAMKEEKNTRIQYQATDRGFVVRNIKFSENYRLYSRSHFVKGDVVYACAPYISSVFLGTLIASSMQVARIKSDEIEDLKVLATSVASALAARKPYWVIDEELGMGYLGHWREREDFKPKNGRWNFKNKLGALNSILSDEVVVVSNAPTLIGTVVSLGSQEQTTPSIVEVTDK
ncbi:hypothetical protein V8G54_020072 [Vigna mungo]|uniref:Uncharacterized protein n=1 Tax=Vigna mungo TaxID=3915 RepID=A0AAQ3NCY4_VIGMU